MSLSKQDLIIVLSTRYLTHRAPRALRDMIATQGLQPSIGETYRSYWNRWFPGREPEPVVFLAVAGTHRYRCHEPEDEWMVLPTNLDFSLLERDPATIGFEKNCQWFMYSGPIPPESIQRFNRYR